jgi:sacsin
LSQNDFCCGVNLPQASEVVIVLDATKYGTTSLMSPSMDQWQGPALCVYNNAVFSARDFANVARIGQGSKLDKLSSTGRFGLGFNAVYHFSDVPSFVSGDSVVFLDPHGIYVPSADGSGAPAPESGASSGGGLKINITNTVVPLDRQFPDQFAPYKALGCDFSKAGAFKGTQVRAWRMF